MQDLRQRIGIDLREHVKIEDGIQLAIEHDIRFLDLKIDVPPNAAHAMSPERMDMIRSACAEHGIRTGVHTMSAVNTAEFAAHVSDGVDRYLIGYMDACKRLGGEWIVVHAGYHFGSDRKARMEASLSRLGRICEYAEKIDLPVLLENMNREPDDAEVHYLAYDIEETLFYFDRLDSERLRWAFTANHAHLVPEGIGGFIEAMGMDRCDEIRLADCFACGKEEHLRPGEGNLDFIDLFKRVEALGYKGRYINAFGTMDDMIRGREYLAELYSDSNL